MSVDDASVQQSASPRRGLLARHPLISFFILAYAGLWLAWMPLVLSEDSVGLLPYNLRAHLLGANVGIYRA
jgi:uncharacterized protein